MEHREVLELLDTLYSMVSEAWGVPLGNDRCIIERNKVLTLLNRIKALLPQELAEASRIVAARDESETDDLETAIQELDFTAGDNEATRLGRILAQERSREVLNNAETRARELYRVVNAYVDDRLGKTESALTSSANAIGNVRRAYRAASAGLEGEPDAAGGDTEDAEAATGAEGVR